MDRSFAILSLRRPITGILQIVNRFYLSRPTFLKEPAGSKFFISECFDFRFSMREHVFMNKKKSKKKKEKRKRKKEKNEKKREKTERRHSLAAGRMIA